uniref:Uncharacterized protein n=1 Tax=Triticum urartu TaxID=4572 RepID=A0A8R7QRR6_TRIUA
MCIGDSERKFRRHPCLSPAAILRNKQKGGIEHVSSRLHPLLKKRGNRSHRKLRKSSRPHCVQTWQKTNTSSLKQHRGFGRVRSRQQGTRRPRPGRVGEISKRGGGTKFPFCLSLPPVSRSLAWLVGRRAEKCTSRHSPQRRTAGSPRPGRTSRPSWPSTGTRTASKRQNGRWIGSWPGGAPSSWSMSGSTKVHRPVSLFMGKQAAELTQMQRCHNCLSHTEATVLVKG